MKGSSEKHERNVPSTASIRRNDFNEHNIKFDELSKRLNVVKKEFGLRRAVSSRSLTGETRTFAEILDHEVEKIVLFYLSVQGDIAKSILDIRNRQTDHAAQFSLSFDGIERLGSEYRKLANDVLDLLNFLDNNMILLKKLIKRHDYLFDQKLGSTYFDTRMGISGKNYQLIQLYHQEGIFAIIGTIRRGLEEYYEAKNTLSDVFEVGGENNEVGVTLEASSTAFGRPPSHLIPRISYRNKLASFSNLRALADVEAGNVSDNDNSRVRAKSLSNQLSGDVKHPTAQKTDGMQRSISQSFLSAFTSQPPKPLKRSISDVEHVLKRIDEAAARVCVSQGQSTVDYIASHSSLGLEISMRDQVRNEEEDSGSIVSGSSEGGEEEGKTGEKSAERWHKKYGRMLRVTTSQVGLYLNLLVTFVFMANQYIVAPTSGQYALLLGMSPALSGVIIGMAPAAVLFSALGYSLWTNYSFKAPLLACVMCGVAGNLLYGMALQFESMGMLLVGRLLTGFAGTRVVSRRYIADHVAYDDRLVASSQFVTISAMGMAFGPLLASLVEKSGLSLRWSPLGAVDHGYAPWIVYTNETAPGWIMLTFWFASFILIFLFFSEPDKHVGFGKKATEAPHHSDDFESSSVIDVADSQLFLNEWGTDESAASSGHTVLAVKGLPVRTRNSNTDRAIKSIQKSSSGRDSGSGNKLIDGSSFTYAPVSMMDMDEKGQEQHISHSIVGVEPGLELYEDLEPDHQEAQEGLRGTGSRTHLSPMQLEILSDMSVPRPSLASQTSDKSDSKWSGANLKKKFEQSNRNNRERQSHDNLGNHLTINIGSLESEAAEFSNTSSPYYSYYQQKKCPAQELSYKQVPVKQSIFGWFMGAKQNYAEITEPKSDMPLASQQQRVQQGQSSGIPSEKLQVEQPPHDLTPVPPHSFWEYISVEVHVLLFLYVLNKGAQELTVSSIPLLTKNMFGWSSENSGYYMAVLGALVLPTSILIHFLVRDMKDRDLLLRLGYVALLAVALIVNTTVLPYTEIQYVMGSVMLFAVLTCLDGVMMSLLSKLVSPELARGTFNSGLLGTEAGTLGRVLGDMTITACASSVHVTDLVNMFYLPVALGMLATVLVTHKFFDLLDD